MATMLQDLIRRRLAEEGWPISRLTKVGGIPKATAYRLLNTELKRMPTDDTVAGLEKALGINATIVRITAAQDLGVEMHIYEEALADPDLQVVIASLLELPREARRAFAEMIYRYRNDLVRGRPISLDDAISIEVPADKAPPRGTESVIAMLERRPRKSQPADGPGETEKVARKRTPRGKS